MTFYNTVLAVVYVVFCPVHCFDINKDWGAKKRPYVLRMRRSEQEQLVFGASRH